MTNKFKKNVLIILVSIPVIFILSLLLLYVAAYVYYYCVAMNKTTDEWTVEIGGKSMPVSPKVTIETKDTPEFASHVIPPFGVHSKRFLCNCVVDSDDQMEGGLFGGGVGIGDDVFHWRLPLPDDAASRLRFLGSNTTLIRQKVEYQGLINQIDSHLALDWRITIFGYLSEDGKYYYLELSHDGGNFANTEIDYYADYNPETMRLTLHIRQKLHWEGYKRYQFEFDLQENPTPERISYGDRELPSIFVPVDLMDYEQ